MSGFLYKSRGDGQVGTGAATFLIAKPELQSGGWYDSEGKLVERFKRFMGRPEGGGPQKVKFYASKPGAAYGENLIAKFTDANGKVYSYNIPNGGERYVGDDDDPESIKADPHGHGGSASMSGVPGQFTPGQVGQYGATPAFIGNMFPKAVLAYFDSIKAAPYKFTDPQKFAEGFGAFNRGEIQKNFTLSQDLALKELGTELEGLKNFVPAASALKRNEISIDNQFNQSQRTQQVNQVLPNAQGDLNAQAGRARSFASGNIPDSVQNSAFELGIRSASADRSAAGGFGASSSVARKASDLLSAAERVNLSKYGDQLLSSNINQQAGLFLAPTEYSNAGSQINVNPSLSASQLINSNLNAINGLTTITPAQGLESTTQQNQFKTNLVQDTNKFNALGNFQESTFNATAQNQFALDLFGYNAGYANSVANAAQTNINTNFQMQQQQLMMQLLQQQISATQNAGILNSIFKIGGGVLESIGGGFLKGGSGGGNDTSSEDIATPFENPAADGFKSTLQGPNY